MKRANTKSSMQGAKGEQSMQTTIREPWVTLFRHTRECSQAILERTLYIVPTTTNHIRISKSHKIIISNGFFLHFTI